MIINRNRVAAIAAALSFLLAGGPLAAKQSGVEKAGRITAIALPVIAGGISAYKNDWTGVGELALVGIGTVGTAYGLKQVISEERPDHSGNDSFPSDTAALAFAPAQYLWDRYGWQYGLPAYAAAAFVGYSRVDADRHHWWDVAASAGIAFGYSKLFTTRFRSNSNLYSSVYATPDSAYVALNYRF